MDQRTLVTGPRSDKKRCTDFPCCLLFLAAIIGVGVVAGVGFTQGDPATLQRFVAGRDFQGNICGHDDVVKDFPLAYFTVKVNTDIPADTYELLDKVEIVCTKSCPSQSVGNGTGVAVARIPGRCPEYAYQNELCSWYGGQPTRVAGYCLDPNLFTVGFNAAQFAEDVKMAGPVICFMPLIALALGFVFLYVVHKCGTTIIWVSMLVMIALPVLLGLFMFFHANGVDVLDDDIADEIPGFSSLTPDTEKKIAYISWAVAGLLLLISLCLCHTINNVAKVLKGASDFLSDVPSQMLQPLVFIVVQLIVFAGMILLMIQVASVNVEEISDPKACVDSIHDGGNPFCIEWGSSSTQTYGLIFLAVMLFWLICFLTALSHYGTSFAVGEWYFDTPDDDGRRLAVFGCCDFRLTLRGVGSGLLNHPGSLAFGALIVSICKIIRLLFFWAKKADQTPQNPIVRFVRCIVDCIADCIIRFVEFVSEHAYVEMALTGHGFCSSASAALKMSIEHPGLFMLVGRVAIAIRIFGMAICGAGTTFFVGLVLYLLPPEGLTSPTAPLVVSCIVGLVIGEVMMHPLSSAARAALHCFVIDEHQHQEQGTEMCQNRPAAVLTYVRESRGVAPQTRGVELG